MWKPRYFGVLCFDIVSRRVFRLAEVIILDFLVNEFFFWFYFDWWFAVSFVDSVHFAWKLVYFSVGGKQIKSEHRHSASSTLTQNVMFTMVGLQYEKHRTRQ